MRRHAPQIWLFILRVNLVSAGQKYPGMMLYLPKEKLFL
jgi:hypothetical protein